MKTPPGSDRKQSPLAVKPQAPTEAEAGPDAALPPILAAMRNLRTGSVEIVVHEGRITYIERREQEQVNLPCPAD